MTGRVKRIIRDRGFGFIRAENGDDIFFNRSNLEEEDFNALEEGTAVEFFLMEGPKGLQALSVRTMKLQQRTS